MFKSLFTPKPNNTIAIDHSSDGQTHQGSQCYSMVLDGIEYEWDIKQFHDLANAGKLEREVYRIPRKFLDEWYWGDSTVDEHVQRTLKADFSFPIIVWDGQIIDGTHRCCLALSAGVRNINAYRVDSMPPHDREYPAKPHQRNPNDHNRTHAHVIREIHSLMIGSKNP